MTREDVFFAIRLLGIIAIVAIGVAALWGS